MLTYDCSEKCLCQLKVISVLVVINNTFITFNKTLLMLLAKLNSEPSQMSKLKLYAKVHNDFKPLTIIEEISSPYSRLGSESVITESVIVIANYS